MPVDTSARLTALRALMTQLQLEAYIVPSEDAHQSEYISECDARREFISGFTGSAGIAVITNTKALLWTDGRYFLQAGQQLDSNWTLMKLGLTETPTKEAWLVSEFTSLKISSARVGVDPLVLSIKASDTLRTTLEGKGHALVPLSDNLIDQVWGQARPNRPANPLKVLDQVKTGQCFTEKLTMIRTELAKPIKDGDVDVQGHALVLTALDDIAWLFNLRGSDIAYNPVFFAYALVSDSQTVLWIDPRQATPDIISHVNKGNVTIRPYQSAVNDMRDMFRVQSSNRDTDTMTRKFIVDSRCNMALVHALGGAENVHVLPRNCIVLAKAIKNPVEIAGFQQCHLHDAAALVTYFAWLEDELVFKGGQGITECSGADTLQQLRSKQPNFVGLSFPTISGSGRNGAIIHYQPDPSTCRPIDPNAVYLCDSGAQYLTGTTDVTRTIHLRGTPTSFEKLANTRVLQGHIALSRATFPRGTTGFTLDAYARAPLWSSGLDYRHGTGHGVGHFLNVHEGPHSISPRTGSLDVPLQPGMVVTNEPGYYHDGDDQQPAFGIRIENILLVVEKEVGHNFGSVGYLGFENVTYVPMDKSLMDKSILRPDEIEWINEYHQQCWDKVSPLLPEHSKAWAWLKRATDPLEVSTA